MRSLDLRFRPLSRPPVSDRELERYAGKWVLVRGGKVVLQASSYEALISTLASHRVKDTAVIYELPFVRPSVQRSTASGSEPGVAASPRGPDLHRI